MTDKNQKGNGGRIKNVRVYSILGVVILAIAYINDITDFIAKLQDSGSVGTIVCIVAIFVICIGLFFVARDPETQITDETKKVIFAIAVAVVLFLIGILVFRGSPVNPPGDPTQPPIITKTPVTITPSPVDLRSVADYEPKSTISPTMMPPGTELKVVNCDSYITLRKEEDGNKGKAVATARPGQTLSFEYESINGFYNVFNGKTYGFAIAAHLVPANSKTFKNKNVDKSAKMFSHTDLTYNNINIGVSTNNNVHTQFGEPKKPPINAYDGYVWEYDNQSFVFDKNNRLIKNIIFGPSVPGPRQMFVGMYMAEALSTIFIGDESIYERNGTHDYILYSNVKGDLVGPYAVVNNRGDAGNGFIAWRNGGDACMDVTIVNSIVTQISVYVTE